MALVLKSPLAELDLLEIWDYIADDSVDVIRILRGSRDIEAI